MHDLCVLASLLMPAPTTVFPASIPSLASMPSLAFALFLLRP